MTATTHHKALEDILGGLPVLAVALSGGVDSRFLVHMALRAGCRVVALHATGPHVAPRETLWARDWAQRTGVRLMLVEFDPLPIPAVTSGSPDRCYHCKRALMQALRRALPEDAACAPLCDGTNADDLAAHRPGLRALHECGVRSPLAEAGIHKAHIRTLGAATGLAAPEQAARPCLLTRLPYGMRPSAPLLRRLSRAEAALEDMGLRDFRLRVRPGAPVLLQLGPSEAVAESGGTSPHPGDMLLTGTAGHLRRGIDAAVLRATLNDAGFPDADIASTDGVSGYFDRTTGGTPVTT